MNIEIIGLSGKIGSGKSEISKRYIVPNGYTSISFGHPVKMHAIFQGLLTYNQAFHEKTEQVRGVLQDVGTESGRNVFGQDIWVNMTFHWMQLLHEENGITKFVIPDVRHENEAKHIQQYGGKIYRVHAPVRNAMANITQEQRAHSSETELDTWTFDGYIYNDPLYKDMIEQQVRDLLK